MHKKIVFLLFLALNSNNIFAEPNIQELSFNEQLTAAKLEALKQQSKCIAQNQDNIYSPLNLMINSTIIVAGSAAIGKTINPSGVGNTSVDKVLVYGFTCMAIASAIVAKDMWISSNLTAQQVVTTSAIANLQKQKNN
jgi:hypothetical protein